MHLAKALATADRLCAGRLSVGLGVGGREEDYAAVGADWSSRTMGEMAARAERLREVWAAGEVGPRPHRPRGPESARRHPRRAHPAARRALGGRAGRDDLERRRGRDRGAVRGRPRRLGGARQAGAEAHHVLLVRTRRDRAGPARAGARPPAALHEPGCRPTWSTRSP
ncbi:LLM class flavin-dependent oxidoreductase [Nocardioides convexus]|uniref:LLM class flavin-dependent oxidoreductase n=1 Tax=Nocardioides convexus TaxID=2712224 RepID=UPI002418B609|nr:LLM class flavin-dependent oxidoreductase [Nocardioides convexus]